jgi:tetratricopeptide (TPR) repeat protein
MDITKRRLRQTPLLRVFMMLGLALVLSAESGTAAFGWEEGRSGRYWLPEDEIDYGEPPPPPRNRPYHSQRPRPQPRPGQDDLRKTLAASVPLLQRMIQLAADDGGIGHIAEIQGLKRRIEALPKPAPGDSKAARILFDNGAVAYEGGLLEDAARYYADARKKDPSDVEIVANLGFTYVKLGNLKTAIEPLTAAATLAPGRSARWTNLAEYYARNGQAREAVACYALAIHFSRNPAKTVEFIGELAQNPDPKVQQAAQQALQLSFVQSIKNPAKATLESPLAEVQPQPESRALPQPAPQPTLAAVSSEKPPTAEPIPESSTPLPQQISPIVIEAKKMKLLPPTSQSNFLETYQNKGGICENQSELISLIRKTAIDVVSECHVSPCEPNQDDFTCKLLRVGFDQSGLLIYYQITFEGPKESKNNNYLDLFDRLYGRSRRMIDIGKKGTFVFNAAQIFQLEINFIFISIPEESTITLLLIYVIHGS